MASRNQAGDSWERQDEAPALLAACLLDLPLPSDTCLPLASFPIPWKYTGWRSKTNPSSRLSHLPTGVPWFWLPLHSLHPFPDSHLGVSASPRALPPGSTGPREREVNKSSKQELPWLQAHTPRWKSQLGPTGLTGSAAHTGIFPLLPRNPTFPCLVSQLLQVNRTR